MQMEALAEGREAVLVIMADRPSPAVIIELNKLEHNLPDNMVLEIITAPKKLRSGEGCNWTGTMQYQYLVMKKYNIDAGMLIDDDCLFSIKLMEELREHLDFLTVDRLECEWRNCTDEEGNNYDRSFPTHRATCLFRAYREDNWSDILTRTTGGGGTHSPIFVARSGSYESAEGRVLHMGYCSPDRREEALLAAKASGQIDPYFLTLAKEPKTTPLVGDKNKWR